MKKKQQIESECIAIDLKTHKCRALKEGVCYGKCNFYCTREEQDKAIEKVFERLRKLPYEYQVDIADKYYGGKMVWRKENKNGKSKEV